MKKILLSLIVGVCIFSTISVFHQFLASENYSVVEYNENGEQVATISTHTTFQSANQARRNLGRNKNYGVKKGDELLSVNYGVVNFNTSEKVHTTNYNLVEEGTDKKTYTNGAYAADGMFLGTSDENTVLVRLSGSNFYVKREQNGVRLSILPYSKNVGVSYYRNDNNQLKHYISTNVKTRPGYGIALAPAPSYLKSNIDYYSYDGHYFYTSYRQMINDLVNEHFNNAVNPNNPFYVYYQYLPYRSTTNYTVKEFKNWFYDKLEYHLPWTGYNGKPLISKLNTTENAFIDSQNKFGANALLTYGTAKNESADGYSNIAQDKLNLFGHAAYDSNAYTSATGYDSNAASIYYHAEMYVSQMYMHIGDWRYSGGHVGNKTSGMALRYASDPYWGEKIAANYYRFDREYGLKDYQYYTIGIEKDNTEMLVYANAGDTAPIYSLKKFGDRPFILLSKHIINGEIWYKVRPDTPINASRTGAEAYDTYKGEYDFNKQYVYMKGSSFKHIINGKLFETEQAPTNPTVPPVKVEPQIQVAINKVNEILETSNTETLLSDVRQGKTADLIHNKQFGNTSVFVVNADGSEKRSGVLSTGNQIQLKFENKVIRTFKVIVLGDVNKDGAINTRDSLEIYRQLRGIKTLSNEAKIAADVNLDGKINTRDSLDIFRHIIKVKELK